jgi:hypothetical protein
MPIYMLRYFAFRIYNYIINCLGFINTYLNVKKRDRNYRRIVIIYKSFIKEECFRVKELRVIRVAILP